MSPYPNIALIGKMATGKTTIAQGLVDSFGYTRFSWAQPVKDIGALAYGEVDKSLPYEVRLADGTHGIRTGREILQRIGTDALRDQVDQDFWIKAGERRLDRFPHERYVNDDTRFPNEVEALLRRGWIVVRVEVPDDLRRSRLYTAYGSVDETLLNHPSETSLDDTPVHIRLWNTTWPAKTVDMLMSALAQLSLTA
jgi:dephospho-CoA kinase